MTRVYNLAVQKGYEWVLPINEDDYEIFRKLDGQPREGSWSAVRVRLLHEDEDGQRLAESDLPWLGAYAPVLRPRAIEATGGLFAASGELLPLICDEARLHVFNALRVVPALDLEQSEIAFFPNTDHIMRIKRYVFIGHLVAEVAIFKVPQLLSHSVYFTGEAVRTIQAAGLTGVGFRLLWDDAGPG